MITSWTPAALLIYVEIVSAPDTAEL